ncbi:MAG: hypothetical protein ACRELG_25805 [Gemmataceae bacterium]
MALVYGERPGLARFTRPDPFFPSGSGYGQLDVDCGTLNFAGIYMTAINIGGGDAPFSDLLDVTGTVNLAGSTLWCYVNGYPVGDGSTHTIIKAGALQNWFYDSSDFNPTIDPNPFKVETDVYNPSWVDVVYSPNP